MIRFQGRPLEVERVIKSTALTDLLHDPNTLLFLEEDPGQAGKFESEYYARQKELIAAGVRFVRPIGDKITRANPVSAQAEVGNIRLVVGTWNESYLEELQDFPDGKDDQVDGTSGAMRQALFFASLLDRTEGVRVIDPNDADEPNAIDPIQQLRQKLRIDDDAQAAETIEEEHDPELESLEPERRAEVMRNREYWRIVTE